MQATIILTFNGNTNDFEKSLFSAVNQNFNKEQYEIFIVGHDCFEVNKMLLLFKQSFKNIKCFPTNKKQSLIKAKNSAIEKATGKYVFLMDGGTIIRRNSLSVSCILHENSLQELIVSFKPFLLNKKETVSVEGVNWMIDADLILTKISLDDHNFELTREFWKDAQFLSFSKSLVTDVGGINEQYYKEDKIGDFIDRMIKKGGVLINPHIMCFQLNGKKS